jgi:hypothetical protein
MTLEGPLSGFRLGEDPLDLADVPVVLRLLQLVHGDGDGLDDRTRELEADLGGGSKLALAKDDGAQVVQVAEAGDGAGGLDLEVAGEDVAVARS